MAPTASTPLPLRPLACVVALTFSNGASITMLFPFVAWMVDDFLSDDDYVLEETGASVPEGVSGVTWSNRVDFLV